MKKISIDSLSRLSDVAKVILSELQGRHIVLFRAEMGAGKTTLIREIVAQCGSDDTVSSPTFAIVNEYHTHQGEPIYHFDMYRISKIAEALDFGCEEYLSSGDLCLIEWPEQIEDLLPDDAMCVEIVVESPKERTFIIDANFFTDALN
ncbi:MAG: tRNA (adenosine(37)-N6)-threonylcarbamoyltransferase complex ATPase subunit type 1 TsaE [Rikenellaceae bacterium]